MGNTARSRYRVRPKSRETRSVMRGCPANSRACGSPLTSCAPRPGAGAVPRRNRRRRRGRLRTARSHGRPTEEDGRSARPGSGDGSRGGSGRHVPTVAPVGGTGGFLFALHGARVAVGCGWGRVRRPVRGVTVRARRVDGTTVLPSLWVVSAGRRKGPSGRGTQRGAADGHRRRGGGRGRRYAGGSGGGVGAGAASVGQPAHVRRLRPGAARTRGAQSGRPRRPGPVLQTHGGVGGVGAPDAGRGVRGARGGGAGQHGCAAEGRPPSRAG
ncbi:hypothetical protein SHIRM173S_00841 [Streptomyces hirsutus]